MVNKIEDKKIIIRRLFFFLFILISQFTFAQIPQSFKYQAVVRDAAGLLAVNKIISIRTSILSGSATGSAVYTETQTLSTNDYGVVSLNIGAGTLVAGNFSTINWGASTYFVKTELDINGASTYVFMGTSQILSVPYALYAEKTGSSLSDNDTSATNELQALSVAGNTLSISSGNSIALPPDADSNPANELQTLSITGDSLHITNGNTVYLSGAVDLDASPTNELQNLSINQGSLSISSGNTIQLPDSSSINELQTLSRTGNIISLSMGGGSVIDSNTTYVGGTGIVIAGTTINSKWTSTFNDISNNNTGNVGIGISSPNPTAKMEVSANNKGFLIPRLTSVQRDAIVNPALGLQIFNITSNCLNFWIGTNWQEMCGSCTPPPTTANAGPDQLMLNFTTTTLQGNIPLLGNYGSGNWSIISGSGGMISDPTLYSSSFTGLTGTIYILIWEITNPCGVSVDTVKISFNGPIPIICGSSTIWVNPIDNSTTVWSNPVIFGGIGATSFVDGEANTNTIVGQFGSGNYAAYICDTSTAFGYNDWYLPAKDELNCITQNPGAVIVLNLSYGYWSSTESQSPSNPNYLWAYTQGPFTTVSIEDKSHSGKIRCIRKNP